MGCWGTLRGCGGGLCSDTPQPTCCSTDQVKGVLTLQGDALSQAVSPCPSAVPHLLSPALLLST